jgi:hypothetical protein
MTEDRPALLILTRTDWHEPPRLRHQVAHLMAARGHSITFVERPDVLAFRKTVSTDGAFKRIRHLQPFHHQLKPTRFLQKIYAGFVERFLRDEVAAAYRGVINFNYDYGFLRSVLGDIPFITIINDDFEAQAKPWMKSAINRQLRATCEASDKVLTVSYPLLDRLREFNEQTELFLPWPDREYRAPAEGPRDICLYYGFVNHRLDYSLIRNMLRSKIRLRMVGPIQGKRAAKEVRSLTEYEGFEYVSPRPLEQVVLDDVCCSIVPYDLSIDSVNAVSYGNRVFRLLSYGIPVIYPSLPGVRTAQGGAILVARDVDGFVESVKDCQKEFGAIQAGIKLFLEEHTSARRYEQLINALFPRGAA